jgi:WD40 repeat protein
VTISRDSQKVVTASLDGTVRVWGFSHSSLSNPPLMTLSNSIDFDPVEEGAGEALALSPDGRRLAAISGNQTVKVWDLVNGRLLHTLTGHSANVYAVAFSPDGKVLASAGDDASIRLWDGVTGQELHTLAENTGSVYCVAFSPDGKYLASAGADKTVRVWSLQWFPSMSGRQVISLPVDDVAQAVVFSPDGKRLAAGVGIGIEVWDLDLGAADLAPKLSLNIPGHGNAVIGLSFSGDGKQLVSGGVEGNARVWDASTGQELFLLAGGAGAISSMALSPDATRLLTASTDGTLKLWDLTSAANQEWFSVSGYSGRLSADGEHLLTYVSGLGTPEGEFQLSDLSTTGIRESHRLSFDPGGMVSAVAYRRDLSQIATVGFDAGSPSLLKIWSVETGQLVTSFPLGGHQDVVFALNFSPDGALIATGSDDGTARVWEVSTGREVLLLTGHTAPIRSVVFSPDGKWLATGSYDGTARLWDARTGKELRTFSGHEAAVITVAFSADETRLATASSDKTARVWDTQTGKETLTLRGHSSGVFWAAFSLDGRQITTGSMDGTAKIWDVATGQELLTFYGMRSEFTPDGKRLIAYGIDGVTRGFFLDMADLVGLARSRLTRTWTEAECQKYLHQSTCLLRKCFLNGQVSLENDQIRPNLPDRCEVYRMAADSGILSNLHAGPSPQMGSVANSQRYPVRDAHRVPMAHVADQLSALANGIWLFLALEPRRAVGASEWGLGETGAQESGT